MLNVVMQNVDILSVITLNVVVLKVIMLDVIIQNVVTLSVIMLIVMAPNFKLSKTLFECGIVKAKTT
jgi:hypothetical protein